MKFVPGVTSVSLCLYDTHCSPIISWTLAINFTLNGTHVLKKNIRDQLPLPQSPSSGHIVSFHPSVYSTIVSGRRLARQSLPGQIVGLDPSSNRAILVSLGLRIRTWTILRIAWYSFGCSEPTTFTPIFSWVDAALVSSTFCNNPWWYNNDYNLPQDTSLNRPM